MASIGLIIFSSIYLCSLLLILNCVLENYGFFSIDGEHPKKQSKVMKEIMIKEPLRLLGEDPIIFVNSYLGCAFLLSVAASGFFSKSKYIPGKTKANFINSIDVFIYINHFP